MTEYPDATRDVRVTKPKPDQPEQTTVQWMADELRKAKSREKKIDAIKNRDDVNAAGIELETM